jgi:hypothetical protein
MSLLRLKLISHMKKLYITSFILFWTFKINAQETTPQTTIESIETEVTEDTQNRVFCPSANVGPGGINDATNLQVWD